MAVVPTSINHLPYRSHCVHQQTLTVLLILMLLTKKKKIEKRSINISCSLWNNTTFTSYSIYALSYSITRVNNHAFESRPNHTFFYHLSSYFQLSLDIVFLSRNWCTYCKFYYNFKLMFNRLSSMSQVLFQYLFKINTFWIVWTLDSWF